MENNPRKGAEGRHEHRPPIGCMLAHCETGEWAVWVTKRSMAAKRFMSWLIYFCHFLIFPGNGKKSAQKAAMSNCPPIGCMRAHYGGRQLGDETRGGAYPDFFLFTFWPHLA